MRAIAAPRRAPLLPRRLRAVPGRTPVIEPARWRGSPSSSRGARRARTPCRARAARRAHAAADARRVRRPAAPARPGARAPRACSRAGHGRVADPLGPARERQDDARAICSPRRAGAELSDASRPCSQGVKEIRAGRRRGRDERSAASGRPTVLFVDEIHRFNKAQQDAFLPHVEAGTITLIGATTENPSFEVNAAAALAHARARARAARATTTFGRCSTRALADRERGLGATGSTLDARGARLPRRARADGDARARSNTLEVAAASRAHARTPGRSTLAVVEEAAQQRALLYDKARRGALQRHLRVHQKSCAAAIPTPRSTG